MNAVKNPDLYSTPPFVKPGADDSYSMTHYLQLILACVHSGVQRSENGVVVAFTAISPAAGVSNVIESFGTELARFTGKQTLIVDAHRLRSLYVSDYTRMPQCCYETSLANLWLLPETEDKGGNNQSEKFSGLSEPDAWHLKPEFGADRIGALRVSFDYILIDCPPLNASSEATILAPFVDGMVIVVEAGRDRRHQIQRAQQTVELAEGRLLGFVLNKRQYPVPKWLYKRL